MTAAVKVLVAGLVTCMCFCGVPTGGSTDHGAAEACEASSTGSSGVLSDPAQEKKICYSIGSMLFMLLSY